MKTNAYILKQAKNVFLFFYFTFDGDFEGDFFNGTESWGFVV